MRDTVPASRPAELSSLATLDCVEEDQFQHQERGSCNEEADQKTPELVECEGEELTQDHTDSPGKMAERTGACQCEGHCPGITPSRIVLVGNAGLCRRGPVSAPGEGVVQLRGGPENPRAGGV